MSKSNKVTFGMIAANMKEAEPTTLDIGDGITLQVKRTLPLNDAISFIEEIVGANINTDEGTYTPEAYDFSMRVAVLHFYAGIDFPKSKDTAKAYRVVYETDLFGKVFDLIDQNQFDILLRAADERIKHECDLMSSVAMQQAEKILDKMNDIFEESSEVMEELDSDDFRTALSNMTKIVQNENLKNTGDKETAAPDDKGKGNGGQSIW